MSKTILQKILATLARAKIKRYRPLIIGITGSFGKTSTRQAIFTVLQKKFLVRTPEKNYNTEIGLPLAILGIPYYGRNIFKWLAAFIRLSLARDYNFPAILLLEYGIDHPGDMDYLLSIARPNIAVVTALGEIPVHVEFFRDPEQVREEKAKLVASLPDDGWAVLNHDDYAVYDMNPVRSQTPPASADVQAHRTSNGMKDKTKAQVLTYGFSEHAEIQIANYKLQTGKDAELGDIPEGITFKINQKGHTIPFRLPDVFGEPQAYATAAAVAVGTILNLNGIEMADAMREYISPPGRLRLLPGVKHTFLLDDSYNAAPDAMRAALETLAALPGRRKIAVLGDMLEIGRFTEQVHRTIGDQAAKFVDVLATVGARAKFIADEARTRGLDAGQHILPENILKFDSSEDAGEALLPLLKPGDLVLIKGSQSMRMEKVVERLMAHPERAAELLVRQESYWKNK